MTTRSRLSAVLRERGLTNSEIRRALSTGKVLLHGVPTADGGREVAPDDVRLVPNAPRLVPGRDLAVVHRDAAMVVVYKPPGLLAVPARNRPDGHMSVLSAVARICGGQALAVHRIDEPTSGLMMVARTEAAQLHLKAQLEAHTVERRYLALVANHPPDRTVTYDSGLVRDRGDGLRGSGPDTEADPARRAVTHVRRVAILDRRTSLVEATLETGRTHQVRIHLSEAGFPILGEPLYAGRSITARAPRLALHAAVLGFEHPDTNEVMRFTAPLADDLEQLRRTLLVDASAASPRRGQSRASKRPARKKKGRWKR